MYYEHYLHSISLLRWVIDEDHWHESVWFTEDFDNAVRSLIEVVLKDHKKAVEEGGNLSFVDDSILDEDPEYFTKKDSK